MLELFGYNELFQLGFLKDKEDRSKVSQHGYQKIINAFRASTVAIGQCWYPYVVFPWSHGGHLSAYMFQSGGKLGKEVRISPLLRAIDSYTMSQFFFFSFM